MPISVTAPVEYAVRRTKLMLFQPFDLAKWFVVGFGAWLAQLGEGGYNFNFNGGGSSGSSSSSTTSPSLGSVVTTVTTWIHDHLGLIIALVVIAVFIIFALYMLVLWLSSRGRFIFLDNIALNRAAIVEPWKKYARLGNNLMWFRMGFQLIAFNLFLLVMVIAFLLMLPDLRAAWPNLENFEIGKGTVLAILVGIGGFLLFGLSIGFCQMCINDFVVPLMYLRGINAWPACKEFVVTMLRGNFWRFVLYGLLKFALALGCGIAAAFIGCLTCCIGLLLMMIPYIGTVVTLPIAVFMRCYGLYFFEQFGENFRIFKDVPRGGFEVILDTPPPPA
jgi:hypothetical protein